MKIVSIKILLTACLIALGSSLANAQDCMKIEYRAVTPTGCGAGGNSDAYTGLTFEIWASANNCYAGTLNEWIALQVRLDLTVGTSNIASVTNTINTASVSSGGGQISVPGNPPAGSSEMGMTFTRNAEPDLTSTPVRLGSITVTFNTPVTTETIITSRDIAGTNNNNGSSYTNLKITPIGTKQDLDVPGATTVTTCAALPVSLLNFDAKKEGNQAILSWATTWETNSDYFEVQQSANAKNWFALGKVYAAGNSKDSRSYTYTDEFPVQGQNHYRLRMVDKDGSESVSKIRSLVFENGANAVIYPNPAKSKVDIKGIELAKIIKISILSTDGKELLTFSNPQQLNVASLSNGIYFVKILEKNGNSHTSKVVVNR